MPGMPGARGRTACTRRAPAAPRRVGGAPAISRPDSASARSASSLLANVTKQKGRRLSVFLCLRGQGAGRAAAQLRLVQRCAPAAAAGSPAAPAAHALQPQPWWQGPGIRRLPPPGFLAATRRRAPWEVHVADGAPLAEVLPHHLIIHLLRAGRAGSAAQQAEVERRRAAEGPGAKRRAIPGLWARRRAPTPHCTLRSRPSPWARGRRRGGGRCPWPHRPARGRGPGSRAGCVRTRRPAGRHPAGARGGGDGGAGHGRPQGLRGVAMRAGGGREGGGGARAVFGVPRKSAPRARRPPPCSHTAVGARPRGSPLPPAPAGSARYTQPGAVGALQRPGGPVAAGAACKAGRCPTSCALPRGLHAFPPHPGATTSPNGAPRRSAAQYLIAAAPLRAHLVAAAAAARLFRVLQLIQLRVRHLQAALAVTEVGGLVHGLS